MSAEEENPFLGLLDEIWVNHILPAVGPGNYFFLAPVCKRLKELHEEYHATLGVILVKPDSHSDKRYKATSTCTFFSEAMMSPSRAELWYEDSKRIVHLEALSPDCKATEDRALAQHWTTCGFASQVAATGNLEVLIWAKQNGLPLDNDLLCPWISAAYAGKLGILQYALGEGYKIEEIVSFKAAAGGHLDILKWVLQNNLPWHEETCGFAAAGGHLDVAEWAHNNGCRDNCRGYARYVPQNPREDEVGQPVPKRRRLDEDGPLEPMP